MIRCATLVEANVNVDFVDINMGCPIDLICAKYAVSLHRLERVVSPANCPDLIPITLFASDPIDYFWQAVLQVLAVLSLFAIPTVVNIHP